jgi:hypothetical protein
MVDVGEQVDLTCVEKVDMEAETRHALILST